jgi:hypothetical protein
MSKNSLSSIYFHSIIEGFAASHQQVTLQWDTRYDQFECKLLDLKTQKVSKIEVSVHDYIIDLVIDKIVFDTEVNEYTKGNGFIFKKEDKLWFSYKSENKFLRQQKPQFIKLDFAHPQEIERNLNRSRLLFFLSINHKGFIRQDIKPSIDEGDAYTLGTHVLEKYRSYFQKVLKEHFDAIPKEKGAVDYELTLSSTVSSVGDKTFEKNVYWYELFNEEKTVDL